MDRRLFLTTLASGFVLAGAGALSGCADNYEGALGSSGTGPSLATTDVPTTDPTPLNYPDGTPVPTATPTSVAGLARFDIPSVRRVPVPGGDIYSIPGNQGLVALTVDDGASSETIKGYCDFVESTGFRMTFFVTSEYDGWRDNRRQLSRLIESGHVQVANHTVTHRDLVKSSDAQVVDELNGCERFLKNTFGVSAHPYFRPPFGSIDDRVRRIASNEGYGTPVLWYGSFGDAGKCSPAQIRNMARRWLLREHIVIGHANFPQVIQVLDDVDAILHLRKLQPVTLDDIFVRA